MDIINSKKTYWLNGISVKSLSLDNRALHFGDGFFTTAKIKNGSVLLLDWHMDRLITSAHRLLFNNVDFDRLYKEILQAVSYRINGVIKIIIIRDHQETIYGYQCHNNAKSLRIIYTYPASQRCVQWYKYGVRLMISTIRIARNSYFSGIKHLNRLEQVMIANEIYNNNTADEALVLDTEDNIIECCSANIFWRIKHQVYTPSVYYSGINGIIRQLILKLLPSLGYCVRETLVGIDQLKKMDEVFITNSLLPLVSVNMINNNTYQDQTLMNLLKNHIN